VFCIDALLGVSCLHQMDQALQFFSGNASLLMKHGIRDGGFVHFESFTHSNLPHLNTSMFSKS